MRSLKSYLDEYSTYHVTSGNQRSHYVGIPMIMITTLGLLAQVPLGPLDFGVLIVLVAMLFYLMLDLKLGLMFLPVILVFYWIGTQISPALNWVLFATGWVLQGVGHAVYEKRSPAFIKNFEHLLIGPLWVFIKIIRRPMP